MSEDKPKEIKTLKIYAALKELVYEDQKIKGLDRVINACKEQGFESSKMRRSGNYKIIGKNEISWKGFNLWELGNDARPVSCFPFIKWVYESVIKRDMDEFLVNIFIENGISKENLGLKEPTSDKIIQDLINKIKERTGASSVTLHF